MFHAVWLACFPDGQVRPARDDNRVSYRLPPLPSLVKLLDSEGGQGFATSVLKALSPGSVVDAYSFCGIEKSAERALPVVALALIDCDGRQCFPT